MLSLYLDYQHVYWTAMFDKIMRTMKQLRLLQLADVGVWPRLIRLELPTSKHWQTHTHGN